MTHPIELLARVLIHVPEAKQAFGHFYGPYANRLRQNYREQMRPDDEAKPTPSRRAVNKRWAELIDRIYEVTPRYNQKGARRLLVQALEEEVSEYIERHHSEKDKQGRALVVRNGRARGRRITMGCGTVEIESPRVNEKRVLGGERQRSRD